MQFPIAFGLAGLVAVAIVIAPKSSVSQLPPSTLSSPTPLPTATPSSDQTSSPKRLTITVSVAQPEDLKVKEGQQLQNLSFYRLLKSSFSPVDRDSGFATP